MKLRLIPTAFATGIAAIAVASFTSAPLHSGGVPIPSRNFSFTVVTHVPPLPPGTHRLRIWLPLPYEERNQAISQLRIASPVHYKIHREKEFENQIAYLEFGNDDIRWPFDIRVTFHAARFENRVSLDVKDDPDRSPVISPARFLLPDRLVPIDGPIAQLSQEQTKDATQPLDKARRIYDYVISTMHFDRDGTGSGRGDALWASDSKHGNSADFDSLFIALARAAGIPARFEIGFALPLNVHESTITNYHSWAQFYVQGVGWVPVDPTEAWQNKEKLDYFFGATDQNRVLFSMGRDIHLKPGQHGDPINFLVYPYAEFDGKPFTGLKTDYSFKDDKMTSTTPHGESSTD
jgi:transglutaminase-like putative cysteine protease